MHQVNIHEAKTKLSKLIDEVLKGEEVIIAKSHKPVVKLVRHRNSAKERTIGLAKDLVIVAKNFNEPLADFKEYSK
jgi:prevent-host-death family protein